MRPARGRRSASSVPAPAPLAGHRPAPAPTRRLPGSTRTAVLAALAALAGSGLTGCTGRDAPAPGERPSTTATAAAAPAAPDARAIPPRLEEAVSEPVEDSVYPEVGDPGVDALHYDLALAWDRESEVLTATERLTFRATRDARRVRLDLAPQLGVSRAVLDGRPVRDHHRGDDLVVRAPVSRDRVHVLELRYAGTPRPVPAPTTRRDTHALGFTVAEDGEVWTMQEPYGAHTWYAVNDQPSDKALYDVRVSVAAPWVGVSNGRLVERAERDGVTTTHWRLDEPAAAYLTTLAIGDYRVTEEAAGEVEVSYWVPWDQPQLLSRLRRTPEVLRWLERRLGPYPFDTLGIVVVDSQSGMETQTMITLGDGAYATSPEVLLHEIAHQWYGDLVTPSDWRDLWMNEGMATYLQGLWQDEERGTPGASLRAWAELEPALRAEAGPPGDYDPRHFAETGVYYGPALMWDALRRRVGDDVFWRLVREWPQQHAGGNADREQYAAWLEAETGEDLDAFLDAWLMGRSSPVG